MTKIIFDENMYKQKYNERGFIKINNIYVPYSVFVLNNNIENYICLECVKSITKNSMISELNKLVKSNNNDLNTYINVINKYGFKYILKKYDNKQVIYVCNEEYSQCFNDSDFADKD